MKFRTVIIATGLLAGFGRVSIADANTDAKKVIQVGVNKAMQLIDEGKFDALSKMCTPDCKFTENGKTTNVEQEMRMMKDEMAQCKDTKMTSTLLTCSLKGNIATCKSHDTMSASVQLPDKKWHKITSVGTSTDTFQKSGSTWLMKSSTSSDEKMTMDGKPYNPNAAAGGAKKQ